MKSRESDGAGNNGILDWNNDTPEDTRNKEEEKESDDDDDKKDKKVKDKDKNKNHNNSQGIKTKTKIKNGKTIQIKTESRTPPKHPQNTEKKYSEPPPAVKDVIGKTVNSVIR